MIDWIIKFIYDFFTVFNNYAKDNQIVAGALSLWGLSVLSYFGRNIPRKIWALMIKQSTTTMTLLSSSQAFYNFMAWFIRCGYSDKMRSIKITSGRWGDDGPRKSTGYGAHYFLYGYTPFKIDMTKDENTNNLMERDEIKVTVLGRSHKFFDILFKEIQEMEMEDERLQVYKYRKDYWQKTSSQMKRDLSTVFLRDNIESAVISHIDTFVAKENWYVSNGLSYQTGILFHGKPGCGKTSLIKALASKYNKPLYVLNAGMLHYIEDAVMELPDKSILVIEDIDAEPVLHKREEDEEESREESVSSGSLPKTKTVKPPPMLSFSNNSDILNALDGIISIHGRILIATTNHIEKLDEALLRDGRFDLKVGVYYADNFVVKNFFKRYYPNFIFDTDFKIKSKISSSEIQSSILRNLKDPEKVLKEIGREANE